MVLFFVRFSMELGLGIRFNIDFKVPVSCDFVNVGLMML